MAIGLTLHQAANTNEILAFKQTGVGHAMTALAELDTYGTVTVAQDAVGGVVLSGYKDAGGIAGAAVQINGVLGEAVDTASSTSAYAVTNFIAKVTNGSTGSTAVPDAGNMASFSNAGSTTRWLIKGNGDTWQSGGATFGGDLTIGENTVVFDSTPSDETVSGITATFTAGEALVRGEVCYFKASDSKMWKAVATAAATSNCVAMAAADISADAAGLFLLKGFLADNGTFPAYTVGGTLYTPEAETSGENVPEQAAPDTDGDFVQVLGWAVTANSVYFDPDSTIVEVS